VTFSRLDLDDELFIDDHVERLPRQWLAAVVDHHSNFAVRAMTLGLQVALEGQCVDEFPVSKAELSVDVEERTDDRAGQVGLEQLVLGGHRSMSGRFIHSVSS